MTLIENVNGFETLGDKAARLSAARLYVLVPGRDSPAAFEDVVRGLLEAKVDVLQLRDKQLTDRELLVRARRLREWTFGTETLFIMNDRPDLARLAGADGVHVGQDELPVADVRAIVGPQAIVGVSTHSIAQARQAVADGADYIGAGPTFPSRTKDFADFPGTRFLSQVAGEIALPAFAIGGITRARLPQVLETGIGRVAIGAAITDASDPASEADWFAAALERR